MDETPAKKAAGFLSPAIKKCIIFTFFRQVLPKKKPPGFSIFSDFLKNCDLKDFFAFLKELW